MKVRSATKTHVVNELKTYRQLKYLNDNDPNILTPTQKAYVERVEFLINRLPGPEREVITKRFLASDSEYIFDYHVFEPMGISDPTYRKMRNRAFTKLAIALGLN